MASWQKHPLIALLAILAFGGYCLYLGMQYSSAAAGEQTTTAHVYRHDTIEHTNCSYNFTVDGIAYGGSDCSRGIPLGHSDATVYYDPSKPSINSLNEFGVASQRWYLYGALDICAGCVLFGVVVFWGAYKKSTPRISISSVPMMGVSRLLKSWATPPASLPMASSFCDCRSDFGDTPLGDIDGLRNDGDDRAIRVADRPYRKVEGSQPRRHRDRDLLSNRLALSNTSAEQI